VLGSDGFAVWAKRLEEGTYAMPFGEEDEARREITAQELGALLSGIDLSTAKRRKRYRRDAWKRIKMDSGGMLCWPTAKFALYFP
jgi:hypothetical protein